MATATRPPGSVTKLLDNMKPGKAEAEEDLWARIYDELRELARYYLRQERPGHSLQATALVIDSKRARLWLAAQLKEGETHDSRRSV
jgi:hypothetical protein